MPRVGQCSISGLSSGEAIIVTPTGQVDAAARGRIPVPMGTIAQRPASPASGSIRYNTDDETLEYHDGNGWRGTSAVMQPSQKRKGSGNLSVASTGRYWTIDVAQFYAPWVTSPDNSTLRILEAGTYLVVALMLVRAGASPWDIVVELRDVTNLGSPVVLRRSRPGLYTNYTGPTRDTHWTMSTIVRPTGQMDLSVWIDPLGRTDITEVSTSMFSQGMTIRRLR